MEKRRLISLRSVLLQYLVRTALTCLLVAVGWLLVLLLWIQNSGLFLPANQAAQTCQKAAQDVLPGMTAATFDETQLDSLCRYALFAAPDSSEVLATNMDAGHLQRAMENRRGKTRWHFGYTQYYMTSKLQDGTVCLLQFDYAVPYADPALRGVLPDIQTVHCILGILLLVGAVVWSTHRTGRFLTRETEKLTAAAQAVAQKDLDNAVFSGAKVREYESALQALQTMGDALTGSLQKQWAMEQRQREQIIQLSHKLKTPLTIIEGNAELLAEDDGLTAEQKARLKAGIRDMEKASDPVHERRIDEDYVLPRPLQVGDTVLIYDIDKIATVLDVPKNGDQILVQAGIIKTRVPLKNLRLTDQKPKEKKKAAGGHRTVTKKMDSAPARNEVDVRGMNLEEALMEVDAFIDHALMHNLNMLTIIHGKGTGILRNGIQQHLRRHKAVKSFRLGVYGEGESGVTIVELK